MLKQIYLEFSFFVAIHFAINALKNYSWKIMNLKLILKTMVIIDKV